MSENKKINETENPILTDKLESVRKPQRKPRKKKMVENGILDESVIPEDTITESSKFTEKTQEPVRGEIPLEDDVYEKSAPARKKHKGKISWEDEVIPSPTFLEKCKDFFAKQAPFWNQPLTIGKAVLIALIACVISTSVSCAGIAKVNTRLDSLENSSSLNAAYLNWIMSPFGAAEAQISSGRRLGITVQDDDSGVIVVGVEDGTSAAKRFRLGDVIVLCNGAPVKTADDILNIVQNLPNDENVVEFSVNRDGKIKTFQVALAE